MNHKKWDLDNTVQYRMWYNAVNKAEGKINRFLKRVGKKMDIPFPLTIYAFRRSSITHAISKGEMPVHLIAEVAGTSVSMIDNHYTNSLQALESYV